MSKYTHAVSHSVLHILVAICTKIHVYMLEARRMIQHLDMYLIGSETKKTAKNTDPT